MMMSDIGSISSRRGGLAGFLFSLPFLLVALGILTVVVIPTLYDWARMQSWQAVEATLISADLKYSDTDGSTTYKTVASYSYLYNQQRYQGSRVGINEKGDNIGDWQRRTVREIQKMQPLRVWVNPANPSESIYDRDLRWEILIFYMPFVLIFGSVGISIGRGALRKQKQRDDVPLWQSNPDWRDNRIRSNAKRGMWAMWGSAAFWNLISAVLLLIFYDELTKGSQTIGVLLIFPLAGIWLLGIALKKTMEWRRFGPTPLRLDPFPGAIGGDVGGVILISQRLPADAVIDVVLSCVHLYQRRSGKNTETERDILWQDRQSARSEMSANGSMIKFCFAVPKGLPAADDPRLPSRHEWTLELNCTLPGVDLDRAYTIPVAPSETVQRSNIQPQIVSGAGHNPVPERLLQIERSGDTLRLHSPLLRHWQTALLLIAVGALFAGIDFYVAFNEVHNGPPFFFKLIFSLIGTTVLLSGLYVLGNTLTVVATPEGIQINRWLYGFTFAKRIAASEIKSLRTAQGMQSTTGGKSIRYYSVKAHTRSGDAIKVAEGLPGASAAEYVIGLLQEVCNVEVTPESFDSATIRRGDKRYGVDDMAEEIAEKHEAIRKVINRLSKIVTIGMVILVLFVILLFLVF